MGAHRMQWNDPALIAQIVAGEKTATVRRVEWHEGIDANNTALRTGAIYSVHDAGGEARCRIRLTGVELARWGAIPERLWRRDPAVSGAVSEAAFRADHAGFFGDPADDFEFLAIYFDRVGD